MNESTWGMFVDIFGAHRNADEDPRITACIDSMELQMMGIKS